MSPTVRLICKVLVVSFLSTSSVSAIAALEQPGMTYEQFMQLSAPNRNARFASLSAAEQAVLKRTHAERWLDAHRGSLSPRQIELVLETIAFVSSDRSRSPQKSDDSTYADELQRRLTCELGRARVTAAFTFLDPVRWSLSSSADEWLARFPDCLPRGRN
jgi:hypothetical protein